MAIDLFKEIPTYAGFETKIRPDINDIIIKNLIYATDKDFLKDIPDDLQLKYLTSAPKEKISKIYINWNKDSIELNNGLEEIPLVSGDTFRFIATNTNTGPLEITFNGKGPYPLTRYNGEKLYGDEIEEGHEVLIRFEEDHFELIPTSTSPVIDFPVYQGPRDIVVSNVKSLLLTIDRLSNKIIINNITITIDSDLIINEEIDLTNIELVNSKLLIQGIGPKNGSINISTDKKAPTPETIFLINNCSDVEINNVNFSSIKNPVTVIESKLTLTNITTNYSIINSINSKDSTVFINDCDFIDSDIISIKAKRSNLFINNSNRVSPKGTTQSYNSMFLHAEQNSTVVIDDNVYIENTYLGIRLDLNSKLYAIHGKYITDFQTKDVPPSIKTLNVNFPLMMNFNSTALVYNYYIENSVYGALCFKSSSVYIQYGTIMNSTISLLSSDNSEIDIKYLDMTGITNTVALSNNGSKITLNNISNIDATGTIFAANKDSSIFATDITYTNNSKSFTLSSAIQNSYIDLNNVTNTVINAGTKTSVDKFSKITALNTYIGNTNIRLNSLTIKGIITNN